MLLDGAAGREWLVHVVSLRVAPTHGGPTVRQAVDAFLDAPKVRGNANTLRAYTNVPDLAAAELGPGGRWLASTTTRSPRR